MRYLPITLLSIVACAPAYAAPPELQAKHDAKMAAQRAAWVAELCTAPQPPAHPFPVVVTYGKAAPRQFAECVQVIPASKEGTVEYRCAAIVK